MSSLHTIRTKLADLKAKDPALDGFGADHHKYRLNPPLSSRALGRFEKEFEVSLPESFATFLTEMGDGGAGPDYGLYSLDRIADGLRQYQRWCEDKSIRFYRLDEPFPFTTADGQTIIDRRNRQPKAESFPTLPLSKQQENAPGVIEICTHGCAYDAHLVVTGEQRGNVWDSEGGLNWYPWGDDMAQADFFSWYEAWLDRWLVPGAIEAWANLLKRKE